jgi:hypothetical protein
MDSLDIQHIGAVRENGRIKRVIVRDITACNFKDAGPFSNNQKLR